MRFSYEQSQYGSHILKTKSGDGADIEILFDGLDASAVYLNEIELPSLDYIKGIYVDMAHGLEQNFVPIANIVQQANAQIEGIVEENEQEERDEQNYIDEVRSMR